MRRPKKSISPSVDAMEPRALPSAAMPLLTMHGLHGIVRDVRAIVRTLSATGAIGPATTRLTRLASRVPGESVALATAWRADLALYSPRTAGASQSLQERLLADLGRFLPVGSGATGPGSTSPPSPGPGPGPGPVQPAPALSLDSVRIQNTTGIDLLVTVRLRVQQIQQPWITQTIPAKGSPTVPFDFGTATNAFMTIDIRRADGGQSPPPFLNVPLNQPMKGYNGALFTISLVSGFFNLTPG
jgi:hypothetical protein